MCHSVAVSARRRPPDAHHAPACARLGTVPPYFLQFNLFLKKNYIWTLGERIFRIWTPELDAVGAEVRRLGAMSHGVEVSGSAAEVADTWQLPQRQDPRR
jgi:hypothetical protein